MPEEAQQDPAVEQDTPAPEVAEDTPTEAPEQTETDAPETDYQKRYEDLQPEYTRATQEAAQYRQIFELAQQGDPEALALLGVEVAQEDENVDEDPAERIERLEQLFVRQEEAQQAQQAQEAFLVDVNTGIEAIEEAEGRTLSDEETRFIIAQAEAQLRAGGELDVASAYQPIETMSKTAVDRYLKSKRQAQSAPLGSAGDEKIDFNNEDARREQMSRLMEAETARAASEES